MTSVTSLGNSGLLSSYLASQSSGTTSTSSSSTSSSSTTDVIASSFNLDFTTYLKILTTQLQNQDPTNAEDPNAFTQELVSLGSFDATLNTNTTLDKLYKLQSTSALSDSLNYVGKYVSATSSTNDIEVNDGTSEFGFTLSGAGSVKIGILDSKGNTVATLTGTGASGANIVKWDGTEDDGTTAPDGAYNFVVTSATDASGAALTVSASTAVFKISSLATNTDGSIELVSTAGSVAATDVTTVSSTLPTATAYTSTGASLKSSSTTSDSGT